MRVWGGGGHVVSVHTYVNEHSYELHDVRQCNNHYTEITVVCLCVRTGSHRKPFECNSNRSCCLHTCNYSWTLHRGAHQHCQQRH